MTANHVRAEAAEQRIEKLEPYRDAHDRLLSHLCRLAGRDIDGAEDVDRAAREVEQRIEKLEAFVDEIRFVLSPRRAHAQRDTIRNAIAAALRDLDATEPTVNPHYAMSPVKHLDPDATEGQTP